MLLSVIIPFYHVEAYIGACLERIAQLPADLCEVILVDDCGSDGSARIAQTYCDQHANFRLLRRERNGGLSAARNTGFAAAKGDYVYFLDSDDLPVPDALLRLVQEAAALNLDIAKGRLVFFDDETGRETPGPAIVHIDVVSGAALFEMQCRACVYEPMVWQCVYRRDFLLQHNLTMAEGLYFEDELFQAPALLRAKRAAAYEMVILRYRQRAGSIMGSFSKSSRWCACYLEVCRRLSSLADTLEDGGARRALKKRVGQIALSVVKNIPAYHLPAEIAKEATNFAKEHRKELSGYAISSGDLFVAVQGMLMRISVDLYLRCYRRG